MAPAKNNEKSAVGEDLAEIRGYIADIRGSIAGINEKIGLLDLIAQKVLGEDAWKKVEDVKKQKEQETLAYEDSNQIESHDDGFLKNINPIVGQIQPITMLEKKTEGDEIQTMRGIDSDVGGSLKRVDQLRYQGQWVTTTESSTVAEEKMAEFNRNTKKKKKKRWKKRFLEIQKCLEEDYRSGKEDTPLGCANDFFGTVNTKRKEAHKAKGGKQREAKRDRYAYQVFDNMRLRGKGVMKKGKRKKNVTRIKRSKYTRGIVSIRISQLTNLHDRAHTCMTLSSNGGNYYWVDTYHVSDRSELLSLTQGRNKVKEDYARKGTKLDKTHYHWMMYAKLSLGYITLKKVRVKWKHEKSNSWMLGIQIGNIFGRKRKRLTEWGKGVRYPLLYTHQMINKRWLLRFIKKKKGRTKTEYDKESNDYIQRLVNAKLTVEDTMVMRQFAKWKKRKFNHKLNTQKKKIKVMVLSDQIEVLWNLKSEHERIRKNFSKWGKKTQCYESAYVRFDNLLSLKGFMMLNKKIAAKNGRGTESEYHQWVQGKFSKYRFVLPQNFSLKLKYPGKLFIERSDEEQEIRSVFYKGRQSKETVILNRKRLATDLNDDIDGESLKRPVRDQRVRKKQNGKWDSLSWSKYKPWKWKHLHFPSRRKRDFRRHSMRRMKGCKSVKDCCIAIDELLLWKIEVKKKKSQSENKAKCRSHSLDFGTAARQVEDRFPKTNNTTKKVKIFKKQGSLAVYTFVIQTRKNASHLRASEHSEKLGGVGSRWKTQKNIGELFCGIGMMMGKWPYVRAFQTLQGHKHSILTWGGPLQLSSVHADTWENMYVGLVEDLSRGYKTEWAEDVAYCLRFPAGSTCQWSQLQHLAREHVVARTTHLKEGSELKAETHVFLRYRQNPTSRQEEAVIKWKGLTEELKNVKENEFLLFNLEDKVVFKGGGNDTSCASEGLVGLVNGLEYYGLG